MRFNVDRCVVCGGPPRTFESIFGLSLEGKMSSWEKFFFCSDDCFEKELNRYMPNELALGKTIADDRNYKAMVADYKSARARFYPDGRLYSNEEKRRIAEFDASEQRIITDYQDEWLNRRGAAIENGLREISLTWIAHHNQEWQQQRKLADERLLSLQRITPIPLGVRFEHTHILAGSGHGKTTLLTHQFLADVQSDAAIIVIDGKGPFVKELQRLKIFEGSDRLVIIRPQDAPALNMFKPPKEEYENAIANFAYIFASKDFKLTAKQGTCFSYCARLLFSMKDATIYTLLDLLSGKAGRFDADIEKQSPIVKRFFADLFYHPTEYGETKRQIQNRLYDLLDNPTFREMFSASECNLDLLDILQNRKILLVDSSLNALGEKAAPLLGRYIIALALNAAHARLHLPKDQWTPAHLIVDEAQMFVDKDKTQPLLQQAREFNLGVTLAHQKLGDLDTTLEATLASNTSIKYVGGVSAQDASFMSKNMNCDVGFIMGQKKTKATTSFACYVRGYTELPVSLSVALGALDNAPKMSDMAYDALIAQNRTRVAPSLQAPKPAPAAPSIPGGLPSVPNTVDPTPVADAQPDSGAGAEAGKDW